MLGINQPTPDFELPDLDGRLHRLSAYRGRVVVLNFWSCECPHSERTDRVITPLLAEWSGQVAMLPIAANRNESAQALSDVAAARGLQIVLLDGDCSVANLYDAQTTPHVFVINREGILGYAGAVDDVTFRQRSPSHPFLEEAVDSLLKGQFPLVTESPPHGCAIVREV